MKSKASLVSFASLLLCLMIGSTMAMAQPGQGAQRDPLRALKRAITEASASPLTTDQETQLNTLITNFRSSLPDEGDDVLEAARTALASALIAGDQTAIQAQIAIIANRTAALVTAKLQAEAQFVTGVIAILKTGGQWNLLVLKFGNDRVLGLVQSLAGRPFDGGGRH